LFWSRRISLYYSCIPCHHITSLHSVLYHVRNGAHTQSCFHLVVARWGTAMLLGNLNSPRTPVKILMNTSFTCA
jgi:hypothetical protein